MKFSVPINPAGRKDEVTTTVLAAMSDGEEPGKFPKDWLEFGGLTAGGVTGNGNVAGEFPAWFAKGFGDAAGDAVGRAGNVEGGAGDPSDGAALGAPPDFEPGGCNVLVMAGILLKFPVAVAKSDAEPGGQAEGAGCTMACRSSEI